MDVLNPIIRGCIIGLASWQIGNFAKLVGLPAISGYLITGVLVGPYSTGILENPERYDWIDHLCLSCISFAAGAELSFTFLRSWTVWIFLACVIMASFSMIFTFFFAASSSLAFTMDMNFDSRVAVALLMAAVLVARSPASAIAVAKELKASGFFTSTAISVSVAMDVVVIIFFSICLEISRSLLSGVAINGLAIFLAILTVGISIVLGTCLGFIIDRFIFTMDLPRTAKSGFILALGFFIFHYLAELRLIAPMLTCVCVGAIINNGRSRKVLHDVINDVLPYNNLGFFTFAGASLALNTLPATFHIASLLFLVRLVALYFGSRAGGLLAKWGDQYCRVAWMAFVTQAGINMGLAKQVLLAFPGWGSGFSSLAISVIILNELVGPPLFKYAIKSVGEAGAEEAKKSEELP